MAKSRLMEVWAGCGQGVGNSLKELSKLTIQLEQTKPVYKMSGIGTHRRAIAKSQLKYTDIEN